MLVLAICTLLYNRSLEPPSYKTETLLTLGWGGLYSWYAEVPGQGSNSCHCSNQSHSSDNAWLNLLSHKGTLIFYNSTCLLPLSAPSNHHSTFYFFFVVVVVLHHFIFYLIFLWFYFFHYSWFTVFCQFLLYSKVSLPSFSLYLYLLCP